MENQEQNPSGTELEAKLEQLNRFTRRTLTQEEVFLFDVRLCDNEIDRDGERFSLEALEQLKALFVGKTGIFDHDPKGENQTARIYAAELVQEPERVTSAGEVYTFLKGHAYMVRTDANRDLIREIDGGIKKEVSISCAAVSKTCSVCGSDRRKNPCAHRVGQLYGEKRCHVVLSDVTDAYEWSFVAVPAQKQAGVLQKQTGGGVPVDEFALKKLQMDAELGKAYRQELETRVTRAALLLGLELDAGLMKRIVRGMAAEELKGLSEGLERRTAELFL